ncbi:MAG: anti-sigma factor [Conexibacteraceae bacterium]|nr:anti-sigma factor [Conexibacteraceae bacterium]
MTETRNSTHDRWDGDAAAYALHALEADEARAFEEHLAACRSCQDELASFREAVAALPTAAPTLTPPPELKRRVMADVTADARARAGAGEQSAPARPARPARPRSRWTDGLSSWRTPQLGVALAAVVAALVVVGLVTLGGSSTRTYPGVVHASGASASVVRSGNSGRLRFVSMPAPPPGRIYQVWLQHPGSAPRPTHTLFASRTGSVAVQGSLHGVQSVLVTAEPRPNGSQAPTRAPIIVVRLA